MPNSDAAVERRARSIFLRSALVLGAGGFALVIAANLWFESQYREMLARSDRQYATLLTQDVALLVRPWVMAMDYEGIALSLRAQMAHCTCTDLAVVDMGGLVLARVTREPSGGLQMREQLGGRLEPPRGPGLSNSRPGTLQAWAMIGGTVPASWVRADVPMMSEGFERRQLRDRTISAGLIGGALLAALTALALTRTYRLVDHREASLIRAQQALVEEVHHDRLTGLLNRAGLMARLEEALTSRRATDQMLAVCFLDLDGFKAVNDRFGHAVGDLLLVEVARRLASSVRASDTVARLAGDEFVLLLEGESLPGEVLRMLERVIERVSQHVPASGGGLRVGVSIGVTVRHSAGDTADSLLEEADQAMYEAKRAGRNRWVLHRSASGTLFNPSALLSPASG